MASKFKLNTPEERAEQMRHNNPKQDQEVINQAVKEIRIDAYGKVIKMIPERFRKAELTDAGIPASDIQSAVMDIFQPAPNGKVGIIFSGPSGCGKTYAVSATMKWIAEKDPERVAYFGFYPKVVQELRGEFSQDTWNDLGSTWDILCNESGLARGVIVLDDVGSSKPSEFELEKLFMVIDHRSNEFLPIIITTNVPSEKFEDFFGQRISSRLSGYFHIINFPPNDFREKIVK